LIVLGIETSTAVCSIGIASNTGLRAERSIVESHIHSEKLLTLIQALCDEQKITLSHLDGIAISIGPGSFTGLRIGLSSAKGLCYAKGIPLITVSTFEAIASGVLASHREFTRIAICVDAKQGEYYIGTYKCNTKQLDEIIPVYVGTLDSVAATVNTPTTVVVTDCSDEVKKVIGGYGLIENILTYCRGDVVASIGLTKLQANELSDITNLEPLYLKDFVVQKHAKSEKPTHFL
jgi:tRNA threonylcarbamoyladenosine biosynthesis protein TsaB